MTPAKPLPVIVTAVPPVRQAGDGDRACDRSTTATGSATAPGLFTYAAVAIPTLSEWALLLMALMLALFGVHRLR